MSVKTESYVFTALSVLTALISLGVAGQEIKGSSKGGSQSYGSVSSGPSSHIITSIILMIVAVVFAGAAVYATPQKKNPQTNVVTTYTVLTVLLAVSNLVNGSVNFITGVSLVSFLTSIILYIIIAFRGGI